MKKLALLFVVLLAFGGVAVFVVYSRVDAPYRGYQAEAQELEIPTGAGTRGIGERLVAAGVVRDTLTYRVALWLSGDARRLKAGEYRFDRPMSAREVLGKIARGEVDLVNITFREGLTIAEMAAHLRGAGTGNRGRHSARRPHRPRSSPTSIRRPTTSRATCFPKPTPCRDTAKPHNSCARWSTDSATCSPPTCARRRPARALTIRQLVTLASIVEKETGSARRSGRWSRRSTRTG